MSKGPWKKKAEVEGASGDAAPKVSHKAKYKKITQDMVSGLVELMNLPLGFITPNYALTEVECSALVVAITDLAAQNVWVNNLIYNLITANTMAELPIVIGAIVVNKLVTAEKVPALTGIATSAILESVAAKRGKSNVAARPARSPDRTDGIGQDNPSEGTSDAEGIHPMSDNQAGYGSLAGSLGEGVSSQADRPV